MKKIWFASVVVLLLAIVTSPAYAVSYQIKIDGIDVPSDVKPELVNNRIMVPLRVISENLGAIVDWSNSEVTITKLHTEIIIKPDSNRAIVNGNTVDLDVKPYLKQNRIFVPLRFIAENFDSQVHYSNATVTIATAPLVIDGTIVKALQHEYRMTMGGVVQQSRGNAYPEAVYQLLNGNKGGQAEAPASFSWHASPDEPGAYYKNGQYDFLDAKGNSIKRFEIYSLHQSFPAETLAGYPEVLLYDASEDEWHAFNREARDSIQHIIDIAAKNGFLIVASDTVV